VLGRRAQAEHEDIDENNEKGSLFHIDNGGSSGCRGPAMKIPDEYTVRPRKTQMRF
jgi:hypothetical protein